MALDRAFFERDPAAVARDLLGKRVLAEDPAGREVAVRVVEAEAYGGPEDPASHATRGRNSQAHRMFETPGRAYVYICYGIHQMLNAVAHPPGEVGAVLLRAGEPLAGLAAMRERRGDADEAQLASGPGNLAEALGVTREACDGARLDEPGGLRVAEGDAVPARDVAVTGRVGVSAGGQRRLRFVDRTSPAASRRPAAGAP